MTRNGDSNGEGEARRRWHQRPAMIPLALVFTLMSFAFGYGQLFGQVQDNTDDIDRLQTSIEKQLAAINGKLDQLFQPRIARREK